MRCILFVLGLVGISFGASPGEEWRSYGNDAGGGRYSSLRQINRNNVKRLKIAWTYHTGEVPEGAISTDRNRVTAFEATPIVVNGVMYFSTQSSRVIALDASNGTELWKFDPQAGVARRKMQAHRGVAYWPGGRILYGTNDGRLIALDARTGKPCPDFGAGGTVDLKAGVADSWPRLEYAVTSPPAIYKDLVIVGAAVPERPGAGPNGRIRAFDARSGKLAWEFHTVPRPGEFGYDTWAEGATRNRTGVNVWSIMSVDEKRGIVYLPVGSPSYDFYGGDRKGQNLFGNSLVALDAGTGKRLWHFQTVHHDIWDYDLPAQPVLAEIGGTPSVIQLTKMGLVYAFDRVTGRSRFPIEERRVPASEAPGEETWPSQPFPLKPPPLSRISITPDELTRVTPESRKYCAELFAAATTGGVFTPWSAKKMTIVLPGTLGGATWSGGAYDPRTALLYVNVNELGAIGMLDKPPPTPARQNVPYERTSPGGEYARFHDPDKLPCQQSPWGTLQAINMVSGDVVWKRPLGVHEALAKRGIKDTGAPSLGGAIVTAGGLVFIAGTGDRRFRAFHSGTGEELWNYELPASGHATPATYWRGRQYVVIAAGGGGYFSSTASDTLVAFSLPE